jgi:hypothetical protein
VGEGILYQPNDLLLQLFGLIFNIDIIKMNKFPLKMIAITMISLKTQERMCADFRRGGITNTHPENEVIDGKSCTISEINSDKKGDFSVAPQAIIPSKYANGSYSVYDVGLWKR